MSPRRLDLTKVMAYGDTLGDGAMQLSFTLPIPSCPEAAEAARRLLKAMGFEHPNVVHQQDLGIGYTFFVAYARCPASVDFTAIEAPRAEVKVLEFDELNARVRAVFGRKLTVLGASTGTDAHSVGLDAILNMKGFDGKPGLERYPEFRVHNLGSQVPNETLVAKAVTLKADAVLVSQVVTQKNVHVPNLTQLVELLEAEGVRDRVVLVCGGPRVSHELAVELGYDAGFGPGTHPPEVASFIVQELERRVAR